MFGFSQKSIELQKKVRAFMDEHVFPNEKAIHEQHSHLPSRWMIAPLIEELKQKAKAAGLWNLFLPFSEHGAGLTNMEYAPLCEIMGRCLYAPEIFNCAAPDTVNMEVLERYGTQAQKDQWLKPLLEGTIRSCYAMTEPHNASSDATNISCSIVRQSDHYLINGRKWWISGAGDPRCKIMILMGKTDPTQHVYSQQSMILVPMDTPGLKVIRPLTVFGYDDAPHGHCEIELNNVKVPLENILLGEGRGFEIAQGRLGPGRIHHCMRAIGQGERALQMMIERVKNRKAFGKPLAAQATVVEIIAECRIELEQARLLVFYAANMMDVYGNKDKNTRKAIAMIKVVAPRVCCQVIDRTIQAFGAAGMCDDFGLGWSYANARTLRIADGPDAVHLRTVGRLEMGGGMVKEKAKGTMSALCAYMDL